MAIPQPWRCWKTKLTVVSQTLDGVPSSAVYEIGAKDTDGKPTGPQLTEDAETVVEFAVPERLASLNFTMEAEVKSLANGQQVKLSAGDSLKVNGITLTDQVSDLHLTHADGQFILEERGRSGEVRAEREVVITVTRPEFTNSISQTLKTDAQGGFPWQAGWCGDAYGPQRCGSGVAVHTAPHLGLTAGGGKY